MLNIVNLTKSFGSRLLFDQVSLQMGPGERLGLVGKNGHGKSTLFKLILNEDSFESGNIGLPKNYRVGHLAQHLNFKMPTILEEACLGLQEGEEDYVYKAEAILFGLGFVKTDMDRAPKEFSGGYQIRLNLAKILVNEPNLLLLDEPTNYLDIISIRWLIKFLRQWKTELILITHDRSFMDQVTTHTAMIHRNKMKRIQGNTQKLFDQIAMEEEIYEKSRVNEDKKRKEVEEFVNRFRAKASKANMVQSRIKLLEKMSGNEKLADIASLGFDFNYAPSQAKVLLEAKNIKFAYEGQPTIINNFSLTVKHGEKIAIIGKNGKGKSTLLNLLAQNLVANSGSVTTNISFKSGFFGQTNISTLDPKLTIEEEIFSANTELSKTAVRSICASMMFTKDDAIKKISILSGGEKSRVLLGKILAKQTNFLFLDEPTNHLDMDSIEALTESLNNFPGSVIIVTHSEALLKNLPTKFVVFQNQDQMVFDGSYEEFLEKVGWEEEQFDKAPPKKVETPRNDKNKSLSQIKKAIDQIEKDIMNHEEKITTHNTAMLKAIEDKKHQAVVEHSQEIKKSEKEIERLFLELEEKNKQLI